MANSEAAGYVFCCNAVTQRECERSGVLAAPMREMVQMRRCIGATTRLFLVNVQAQTVVGPFVVAGDPAHAVVSGNLGTGRMAQVKVASLPEEPILEASLEHRQTPGPRTGDDVEELAYLLLYAGEATEAWASLEPSSGLGACEEEVCEQADESAELADPTEEAGLGNGDEGTVGEDAYMVIGEEEKEAEVDGETNACTGELETTAALSEDAVEGIARGNTQQPTGQSTLKLQEWAGRVNNLASGRAEFTESCKDFVRKRILRAHAEGNLHSIDWDAEPVPDLSSFDGMGGEGMPSHKVPTAQRTEIKVQRTENDGMTEAAPAYVFHCNNSTEVECQSLGLFGAPDRELEKMMRCIHPSTELFLFNFQASKLVGPFSAVGSPQRGIARTAFYGKFNAQVRISPLQMPILAVRTEARLAPGPKTADEADALQAQLLQGEEVTGWCDSEDALQQEETCLDQGQPSEANDVPVSGSPREGYVFVCSTATQAECQSRSLLGAGEAELERMMASIDARTLIFLWNLQTWKLIGPFAANGDPGRSIVPGAFGGKFSAHLRVVPSDEIVREVQLERRLSAGPAPATAAEALRAQLIAEGCMSESWTDAQDENVEPAAKRQRVSASGWRSSWSGGSSFKASAGDSSKGQRWQPASSATYNWKGKGKTAKSGKGQRCSW
eukprot:TRINITY_DN14124_c1_g3_i1.p1 TRINITY_DN14124_c1_g3~~TRINITY_DN14124_c1_g3_i1.p1  ORF type:complete len:670 (+),score=109.62 TRINITY_DN14124_c1_g3_i1:78-2087(+)